MAATVMKLTVTARSIETRFYNENNQFTIAVYSAYAKNIPEEYRTREKRKVRFSAKGTALPTPKKYDVQLEGNFSYNEKFGLTMNVTGFSIVEPSDEEGIQQYLVDFVDGIGPKTAARITSFFGSDTLRIFNEEPERLFEIPRLRKHTIEKMLLSYNNTKNFAELIKLLAPYDISTQTAIKIQNHFGDARHNAIDFIKENPFILSEINGFTFNVLDSMGNTFGLDPCNEKRICCGIEAVLKSAQLAGHLYLPQSELRERSLMLLNRSYPDKPPVTREIVTKCICDMAKNYRLLGDNGNAYLQDNYCYETKSASIIKKLLNVKCKHYDVDKYLPDIEKKMNIELSKNQCEAVNMAVNNQISICIGGAGTGKTTVLKTILKVLYKLGYQEQDICLAAPTGKAVYRLTELTGHAASTIHSLLGIRANEDVSIEEQIELDCKMLIIDEFSMADMFMTYKILTSIDPSKTKLLFVGDTGQLPSVGAGNVLHEMLVSNKIPTTKLFVIFRQCQENLIVRNSANIRRGIQRVDFDDNFVLIPEKNSSRAAEITTEMYINAVYKYGIDNVQVLSPIKNRGECCTKSLNKRIQAVINPPSPNKADKQIGDNLFRVKDRVIQTKNIEVSVVTTDGESKSERVSISNGDTGQILSITKSNEKGWIFKVNFGYGRIVNLDREDMLNVDLAYALTIHKSQGSEYQYVIVPLLPYFPNKLLFRNLLYTGITRAKEKLIIVGSKNCIHQCIRNDEIVKRNTMLGRRIAEAK